MGTRLTQRQLATVESISRHDSAHKRIQAVCDQITEPTYVVDELLLHANGQRLAAIQEATGCKINLALKAFAGQHVFHALEPYLTGMSASSVNEARLAYEAFGKEVHVYSPAFSESEMQDVLTYASHVVFNSFAQLERFKGMIDASERPISIGIRVNPEFSVSQHDMFDPCAPFSRFGVTQDEFCPSLAEHIEGFHVHALCQESAESLGLVLKHLEIKFGPYLSALQWINLGGGHHLTHPLYNTDKLCQIINAFQERYDVQVILEPGEAVVYQTGYYVTRVVDVMRNQIDIAILEGSAKAHTPDILEMGTYHEVVGAGLANQKPFTYRLAGKTCQANDIFGDYSFDEPLRVGQTLIFTDMSQYTSVKNSSFNGINLPSLARLDVNGQYHKDKDFDYDDYRCRV